MKQKVAYLILGFFLAVTTAAAQTPNPQDTLDKARINGYKFNTGTLQDILTNYLQVAAKNITSTNTSLQLKLNWFALNSMDSADKYNNINFLRTGWQRNGEFTTSVGVDKNNNFNSWQGGFTYNFLNRRDTSMAFYTKAYLRPFAEEDAIINAVVTQASPGVSVQLKPLLTAWLTGLYNNGQPIKEFKKQLGASVPDMFQHTSSDDAMANYLVTQFNNDLKARQPLGPAMTRRIQDFADYVAIEIVTGPLNAYIRSLGKTPLKYANYITPAQTTTLTTFIDQQVAQNAYLNGTLKATTLTELNKKVIADYNALVRYVGRQPLLTAGYLYTYGKGSMLSSHVGSINFLYGTGSWNTLKTGQIKASLTDTLNSNDPTGKLRNFKRNIVSLQVGYNQVLVMQKKVSVMELSGALELNNATSGYVSGTNKSKFYFDAFFRARLPSTPWLKFDLKWDPKDGNVLGFFDFTYNLDKP
ncbi:hypothetical protein [Mucilaginibacter gilvus]|uniref:Uncharacterized protein n=1 Tax=Mucilaginibacter gilvus TaxID=2305909 RepID=A0A444MLA2_9SPHI|nr:hypothetical protein [Mucilaginibacter gilvus]RWY50087.1 hypothetical protein EPL05_15105 [Mucilaginibacter gilvus]